jgi:rhodanese-related sulfurtransferase
MGNCPTEKVYDWFPKQPQKNENDENPQSEQMPGGRGASVPGFKKNHPRPIIWGAKFPVVLSQRGTKVTPRRTIAVFLAILALLPVSGALALANGKTAPQEASPADSGPFSVDMDDFEGRMLVWSYFRALADREDIMIIDVRSGFLPATEPPGLSKVRPVPLEIFLQNFVGRKVHQDKTLLIFDQSGDDLRRLQFHLQKNGYDNYFFLDGGSESTLSRQTDRS